MRQDSSEIQAIQEKYKAKDRQNKRETSQETREMNEGPASRAVSVTTKSQTPVSDKMYARPSAQGEAVQRRSVPDAYIVATCDNQRQAVGSGVGLDEHFSSSLGRSIGVGGLERRLVLAKLAAYAGWRLAIHLIRAHMYKELELLLAALDSRHRRGERHTHDRNKVAEVSYSLWLCAAMAPPRGTWRAQ